MQTPIERLGAASRKLDAARAALSGEIVISTPLQTPPSGVTSGDAARGTSERRLRDVNAAPRCRSGVREPKHRSRPAERRNSRYFGPFAGGGGENGEEACEGLACPFFLKTP